MELLELPLTAARAVTVYALLLLMIRALGKMLRQHGVGDASEVRLATIETDGKLSVLKVEWAELATRADVDCGAAAQRRTAASSARPTDSPAALGER